MESVARYAAERGLDAPRAGGARGGEAGQRPVEGGGEKDGGQGAFDRPSRGGGGDMEEDVIHINHEARGPGEEGLLGHEDAPEFHPATRERMVDWLPRAAKGAVPALTGLREDGPSKREEGGADPATTQAGKRLRQQKVIEVYDYIVACRQLEDFHMQQGRFGDWRGAEGRARGGACSSETETIECASWWSLYGAGAPELQRCALRVMHMWSCASLAERNWVVHEGIHTKKRNQLAFKKVMQLVEITTNVWLTEYRQAGCGYVLPWQRDEGMLDCQSGIQLEPVRTGTRKGMTQEQIAHPAPLPAPGPVSPSPVSPVQPRATEVETQELASSYPQHGLLHRSTAIRRLRLQSPSPRVLQEEVGHHTTPTDMGGAAAAKVEVTAAPAVEAEVAVAQEEVRGVATGEEEVRVGVAVVGEEVDGVDAEERLVQQFITEEVDLVVAGFTPGVARGLGMSPPTGCAGSEMGTHFDFDLSMDAPPSCGGAASTGRAPSMNEAAGETGSRTSRERTAAESRDAACDIIERERAQLMAFSDPRAQAFALALEERRHRETGRDGRQGGVVAREVRTNVIEAVAEEAVDKVVESGPQTVGEAVLGGPQMVDEAAKASARVVVLRKGGDPVTIEEDDHETTPAAREDDEDYEGEGEGEEEESESGDGDDDDDDEDEPPPPPPTRASRRVAHTSPPTRGKRIRASSNRGGTSRQSGRGKRGR
ncbi:hypothetical protein CBR_g12476 [Chara braunii]|uniref:HAT C-terminal dimerisation domain-containing protein n=1 Tax=Chara braunii TaxID=69332 RepID=A0A388JSE9_CHABU|nr:hypothetical protein CBR_g12476 [Chara braunii]|eukprot:GBG60738.1 hypothetical protein CBR_g12476 [Chara braunii]